MSDRPVIGKTFVMESHRWMEDYYGQLVGAIIEDIVIAIDDKNEYAAFPRITFRLPSGEKIITELASAVDENIPGVIYGLSWTEEMFEKTPNVG